MSPESLNPFIIKWSRENIYYGSNLHWLMTKCTFSIIDQLSKPHFNILPPISYILYFYCQAIKGKSYLNVSNTHQKINNWMHISKNWSIEQNNLSVFLHQIRIYFLSVVNKLVGKHIFYGMNWNCSIDNKMHILFLINKLNKKNLM